MKTPRKLLEIALFAALTAALGFLLIPLPNIELVTFSLFVSGYVLGTGSGIAVAVLAITIFYGFNPHGSSFAIPYLLASQVLAGVFIAVLGGLYRVVVPSAPRARKIRMAVLVPFAVIASLCLTIVPSLTLHFFVAGPWQGWIFLGTLMTGWGFVFNIVVFLSVFEPLVAQLSRIKTARGYSQAGDP